MSNTPPDRANPPTADPTSSAAPQDAETDSPSSATPTMAEAPDVDTTAWEGAEPNDPIRLVDPRHEIPGPPGM